uniref:Fanconi Anaemia group E protein C-terminal domain-containing protein n=1 Tax=Geospiza parvula TaxID=87175 RepID=A0A8U8C323_GEOPR
RQRPGVGLGARGSMEPRCRPWLQRCPRPCRLLLHALSSGPAGATAALRALQRGRPQQGPGLPFPWPALSAALCAEEPSLEGPQDALAVKPRLLLLPVLCQRNLFSLLLVVQDAVPRDCLRQLLQALQQDSRVDPWVQALGDVLQQGPRAEESSPRPTALSAACQQQLRGLCQKIAQKKPEGQRKLSWCFSKQAGAPESVPRGGKRDREGKEEVACEPQECGDVAEVEEEVPEEPPGDTRAQSTEKAAQDSSQQDAAGEPRRISQTELAGKGEALELYFVFWFIWCFTQDSVSLQHPELHPPSKLSILNSCTPSQLEGLCSFLQLSTCPEPSLGRFCSWLLPLSPALSHTSAAILAQQLFLRRVLALTQPPSRHLMAALTSFCSKYSHPLCRVLVAAVLQGPGEGVQGCWEPWLFLGGVCHLLGTMESSPFPLHCPCSQVLEVPLSEKLLPVLQAVLGRQVRSPLSHGCPW